MGSHNSVLFPPRTAVAGGPMILMYKPAPFGQLGTAAVSPSLWLRGLSASSAHRIGLQRLEERGLRGQVICGAQHAVDDAVLEGLVGVEVLGARRVELHLFDRLTRLFGDD